MLAPALPRVLSLSTSRTGPGHVAVAKRLVVAERVVARWSSVYVRNSSNSASRERVAETVLPEPQRAGGKDCPDWG